jgi:hypothetical protein
LSESDCVRKGLSEPLGFKVHTAWHFFSSADARTSDSFHSLKVKHLHFIQPPLHEHILRRSSCHGIVFGTAKGHDTNESKLMIDIAVSVI